MNHKRLFFFSLIIYKSHIKPLWQIEIKLNCGELSLSSYYIFDFEINFWSVKCSFSFLSSKFNSFFCQNFFDCRFCNISHIISSKIFFFVVWVSKRSIDIYIFEIKLSKNLQSKIHNFPKLFF